MSLSIEIQKKPKEKIEVRQVCSSTEVFNLKEVQEISGVRIDIWTHFMRECIIDYVH